MYKRECWKCFTNQSEASSPKVECPCPWVAQPRGGVVHVGEDHAGEDGHSALQTGQHREHLPCLLWADAPGHLGPDGGWEEVTANLNTDGGQEEALSSSSQSSEDLSGNTGEPRQHNDDVVIQVQAVEEDAEDKNTGCCCEFLQTCILYYPSAFESRIPEP